MFLPLLNWHVIEIQKWKNLAGTAVQSSQNERKDEVTRMIPEIICFKQCQDSLLHFSMSDLRCLLNQADFTGEIENCAKGDIGRGRGMGS